MIRLSKDPVNTCLAKISYLTRLDAEMAMIALMRKGKGKKDRLHVYGCTLGGKRHWHLGRIRRKRNGSLVDSRNGTMDWQLDWSNCHGESCYEQEG